MKELIRKIIQEQITVDDFCLPIKGWDGTIDAGSQSFTSCRKACVKYDPDDATKCIEWDSCGRKHKSVDLSVPSGTELRAPADGDVITSDIAGKCGGRLIIDHGDGITTKYCHLKHRDVDRGDPVTKNQLIGLVGGDSGDVGNGNSSYAHLHYQVLKNGVAIDPVSNGYLDNDVCNTGCIAGNCINGTGTFVWDDGDRYEGDFRSGLEDGYGTKYWSNGAVYRGEWVKGEMHGQGTYIYANGDTYTGENEHDEFEGEGKMVYANGTIEEGIWHEDNYMGPLVLANPKVTRSLQDLLVKAGYLEADNFIYGEMDGVTMQAIKDIQEANGITETGVMDTETFLVLDKESRE